MSEPTASLTATDEVGQKDELTASGSTIAEANDAELLIQEVKEEEAEDKAHLLVEDEAETKSISSSIVSPSPAGGSEKEARDMSELEETRRLEVHLSRLPDPVSDQEDDEQVVSPRSPSLPPSSEEPVISPKQKQNLRKKAPEKKILAKARERHLILSQKKVAALKRKKLSAPTSQIKIKMNFFKNKEASGKSTVTRGGHLSSRKVFEDFEAKERDAAEEASKKILESTAKAAAAAEVVPKEPSPAKVISKPCSDSDGSDSSDDERREERWADENGYRPMRAAAAAALEAVHGKRKDVDSILKLRAKYPSKGIIPRGKGRRTLAKRNQRRNGIQHCTKVPGFEMPKSVFYNNVYFQIGDVVAVCSESDKMSYFGQILYLMTDQENQYFVEFVWLTPNTRCPRFPFDPQNYDRRDDCPPSKQLLAACEFIMHLPWDYYNNENTEIYQKPQPGMVFQRLNRLLVADEEIDESEEEDLKPETPSPFPDAEGYSQTSEQVSSNLRFLTY